jgi:hypothetical protein
LQHLHKQSGAPATRPDLIHIAKGTHNFNYVAKWALTLHVSILTDFLTKNFNFEPKTANRTTRSESTSKNAAFYLRVGKNPVFKKKPAQWVFWLFFF